MSSERMYSLAEVREILDIYVEKLGHFNLEQGHGYFHVKEAQKLLDAMKKYPKIFEEQIRNFDITIQQEKSDLGLK